MKKLRPQKRKFDGEAELSSPSHTAWQRTIQPPIRPTKIFQPAVLAALLSEIQRLGKTTIRLKAEQAAIKQELQEWNAVNQAQSPPSSPELPIVPAPKRQRILSDLAPAPIPRAVSDFVIDDPLKPFAILRPRYFGSEFVLFPIAANASMGNLLGFTAGETPTEQHCLQVVPAHVPLNALAKEEMYRLFLMKSSNPHSNIMARSITYRTKTGKYIDADTRKQFFYNENGDPSFVIVCIDRVFVPSHFVFHTQNEAALANVPPPETQGQPEYSPVQEEGKTDSCTASPLSPFSDDIPSTPGQEDVFSNLSVESPSPLLQGTFSWLTFDSY